MTVFIIAEAGSSHDNDLQKAYRLIDAAKECGADAAKFQFWSSPKKLAERRGLGAEAEKVYTKYQLPQGWLPLLKAHCDKVGIEFMCTVYLIEDIATIAPLVKLFKVSAFEAQWREFVSAHCNYEKGIIISVNPGMKRLPFCRDSNFLYCVSKYPTPLEDLHLRLRQQFDGLSDHTANVLTGAAAVAAGARIVEAHIRLHDTNPSNPDFPHSLQTDMAGENKKFYTYVRNIRTVERML